MKNYLSNLANTGNQFVVYFVNGYQGRYTLVDFYEDSLLVKDKNGKLQIILLHAVSTIELG